MKTKNCRVTARENNFIVTPDKKIILRVSAINGIVNNIRQATCEPYLLILTSEKNHPIPLSKENFDFISNELSKK